MRYFTVRAENTKLQTVKDVDIPARQLLLLFNDFETQLREDGIFAEKEELLKRVVPHAEGMVYALQIQIFQFDKDIAELGDLEYDVYLNGMSRNALNLSLNSLSLWFCSIQSAKICSVTLPVSQLFHSIMDDLKREMVKNEVPSDEPEEWRFKVFLDGEGLLYIPRMHRSKTLQVMIMIDDPKGSYTKDNKEMPQVDVKVTERKALIVPEKKPWKNYEAEVVGVRQRGDLQILMSRLVVDRIWSSLTEYIHLKDKSRIYEMGGFLFGGVFIDEKNKPFIDIDEFMTVDTQTQLSFTGLLRYSPELLQESVQKMKDVYPEKKRLGWYHAHLVRGRTNSLLELGWITSKLDFSSSDKDLHMSLFREPWQVAMIIDIEKHKFDFYQWKRNEVERCSGFYTYSP
jgi:hypothetical protein